MDRIPEHLINIASPEKVQAVPALTPEPLRMTKDVGKLVATAVEAAIDVIPIK